MRLSPEEVHAIKVSARLAFGETAVVRLFGSRVHDHLRGGDIDLHVEVDAGIDPVAARGRFEDALFARIEEQHVDVILHERGRDRAGIDLIALRDGVEL